MDVSMFIVDIIIASYSLLFHCRLTVTRKNTTALRLVKYLAPVILIALELVCTYVLDFPAGISSLFFFSVPLFLFLLVISEHRDTRFIVTYSMVDSGIYIIGTLTRVIRFATGDVGGALACAFALLVLTITYVYAAPHFEKYRDILYGVKSGWYATMVACIVAHYSMIFISQYPSPIAKRPEDMPIMLVVCLMVITFYIVFMSNIVNKKMLRDANARLSEEQQWHNKAYVDSLTGVKNRMAYVERINMLERDLLADSNLYAIMVDIDRFKEINDRQGHHSGDKALIEVAGELRRIFPRPQYKLFRIGGDEFAVIGIEVEEADVAAKVSELNSGMLIGRIGCTVSAGYVPVDPEENTAIESAFIRADDAMYAEKRRKKEDQ